jgi:hypothetical protein
VQVGRLCPSIHLESYRMVPERGSDSAHTDSTGLRRQPTHETCTATFKWNQKKSSFDTIALESIHFCFTLVIQPGIPTNTTEELCNGLVAGSQVTTQGAHTDSTGLRRQPTHETCTATLRAASTETEQPVSWPDFRQQDHCTVPPWCWLEYQVLSLLQVICSWVLEIEV